MSEPGMGEVQPSDEQRGPLEGKTLKELGTALVSITDEVTQWRGDWISAHMEGLGIPLEKVFDELASPDPDKPPSEDVEEYKATEQMLFEDEGDVITKHMDSALDFTMPGSEVYIPDAGKAIIVTPYTDPDQHIELYRIQTFMPDETGVIIQHVSEMPIDDDMAFLFQTSPTTMVEQDTAGVNRIPLTLDQADRFVHALRSARDELRQGMYEPHSPTQPE